MPGIMNGLVLRPDPKPTLKFVSASNNAAWSVGEVSLRFGRGEFSHPPSRMYPNHVAPHLGKFAQAWCQALYEIGDNKENGSAFRGLCTLVRQPLLGLRR